MAAPVLSRSSVLTDTDLLEVVNKRGQDYLRAVSRRVDLSETVSDVIVERGDDTTLGVLLQNETAVLSRRSAETVVDRASVNPDLHAAVVRELYGVTDQVQQILANARGVPAHKAWYIGPKGGGNKSRFLARAALQNIDGFFDESRRVDVAHLGHELAGFDLREVENIPD